LYIFLEPVLATGYNIVDVDVAKERGILVTNVVNK
jgi:lactate dehydrogenase-like 2-hydroxyacid dehydrogenase